MPCRWSSWLAQAFDDYGKKNGRAFAATNLTKDQVSTKDCLGFYALAQVFGIAVPYAVGLDIGFARGSRAKGQCPNGTAIPKLGASGIKS